MALKTLCNPKFVLKCIFFFFFFAIQQMHEFFIIFILGNCSLKTILDFGLFISCQDRFSIHS